MSEDDEDVDLIPTYEYEGIDTSVACMLTRFHQDKLVLGGKNGQPISWPRYHAFCVFFMNLPDTVEALRQAVHAVFDEHFPVSYVNIHDDGCIEVCANARSNRAPAHFPAW